MQFKRELANKILAGEKTQTRRPVKVNEYQTTHDDLVEVRNGRLKWRVGKTYSVQPGRGKKGEGFMKLTSIRREKVESITEDDVMAEGLVSRDKFLEIWNGFYGDAYPECWVLEFELVEGEA